MMLAAFEVGQTFSLPPAPARFSLGRLKVCPTIWLLCAFATSGSLAADADSAAASFLYLPPSLESRVLFYHSFERGVSQPEIDLIDAKISCGDRKVVPGLAGRGSSCDSRDAAKRPLHIESPALSAHRPLTAMMWWRLDGPMKPETCYHLVRLAGRGYIAAFARGKGKWCALTRPTFIFQVQSFRGIPNRNDHWTGHAWVEPGEWHHVALTVATASDVRVYWDGKLRVRYGLKGRRFAEGDTRSLECGPSWLFHPTTVDEVVVLDKALDEREIRAYVVETRKLAEVNAPVRAR